MNLNYSSWRLIFSCVRCQVRHILPGCFLFSSQHKYHKTKKFHVFSLILFIINLKRLLYETLRKIDEKKTENKLCIVLCIRYTHVRNVRNVVTLLYWYMYSRKIRKSWIVTVTVTVWVIERVRWRMNTETVWATVRVIVRVKGSVRWMVNTGTVERRIECSVKKVAKTSNVCI